MPTTCNQTFCSFPLRNENDVSVQCFLNFLLKYNTYTKSVQTISIYLNELSQVNTYIPTSSPHRVRKRQFPHLNAPFIPPPNPYSSCSSTQVITIMITNPQISFACFELLIKMESIVQFLHVWFLSLNMFIRLTCILYVAVIVHFQFSNCIPL